MLEKLKERVKNWMQKTGAETGLSKEFKDIFEVGGVPAFNQFYYFGIFIWKYLYKDFTALGTGYWLLPLKIRETGATWKEWTSQKL